MTDELMAKIERLEAQVAALADERLPKVDRESKRRDRRQVLGGLGMFVVAALWAGMLSASALAGSNTVTSDDIVDNGIYHTDVRDNTLTGIDVNERTLNLTGNCSNGVIKGSILVDGFEGSGTSGIPSEYSDSWGIYKYNCSGGRVFVRRQSAGSYDVKFEGNGYRGVTATPTNPSDLVGARDVNPGEFRVYTTNTANIYTDSAFTLIIW